MAHEKTVYPVNVTGTCSSCKFGDMIVNPANATSQLFCRKNPPRAGGQCIGVDQISKQPSWVFATFWPAVQTTDWCAEHSPRLSS